MTPSHASAPVRTGGEALTGAHAGRVLSREIKTIGAPTLLIEAEGNIAQRRQARAAVGPRAVEDPGHVRNLHAREPGDPGSPALDGRRRAAPGRPRP